MSRITREQLQQLSKDELIDIILRQQEIIELQQARIEQLEARVAELEAQVERLTLTGTARSEAGRRLPGSLAHPGTGGPAFRPSGRHRDEIQKIG